MKEFLQKIDNIFQRHPSFGDKFWEEIIDLAKSDRTKFSNYLIERLEKGVLATGFRDFQITLGLIQGVYPFEESSIINFVDSLSNVLHELIALENEFRVWERDNLLYILMDIIFHHPEIIENLLWT